MQRVHNPWHRILSWYRSVAVNQEAIAQKSSLDAQENKNQRSANIVRTLRFNSIIILFLCYADIFGTGAEFYKRSAFIILSYREYEKRRGMNEKIQASKRKLLHEHRLSSVQIY